MRRGPILVMCVTLLASCGAGESTPSTTGAEAATTSTTRPEPTTAPPPTSTTPPTTVPVTTADTGVDALAWGLFCRDLVAAGWDYGSAVAYWDIEGRPARMDADENGIPCETVYPADDVAAHWGEPLPTGLAPGAGSGWRTSQRTSAITPGCCSMNDNGPVSPPLPPDTGGFPDDGAFAVDVARSEGGTEALTVTIRRWLACSEDREECMPDLFPGDVYADPDDSITMTIGLDRDLTVVVRTIPSYVGGEWTDRAIEGDGTALASLLHRIDAATRTIAAPAYSRVGDGYGFEADFLAVGADDPTFPYGPAPVYDDGGSLLGYRGPEGSFLTPGFWAVFGGDDPDWLYGWWRTLEVVDGGPVLYLWAGQIAG